jgi:hypothetical protein
LVFRGLRRFFTVFHLFFTPYFSHSWLILRRLEKMDRHKRRIIAKFGVRIRNWRHELLGKTRKSGPATGKPSEMKVKNCRGISRHKQFKMQSSKLKIGVSFHLCRFRLRSEATAGQVVPLNG